MNPSNLFVNLFGNKTANSYTAGQTIVESGAQGQTMFIVLDGQIEICAGDRALEVGGPGTIFGEMALIDDSPRSATVKARTDCRLAEVSRKQFEFMVSETPFFALAVMRVMADRLREATAASGNRASSTASSTTASA